MKNLFLLLLVICWISAIGQTPSKFDFGKMWTFENPPTQHFAETYDFEPEEGWFEDVRMAALRFSTFCSASFVSSQGLIMTNHHCSRSLIPQIQEEGENLDANGFTAESPDEERQVPGLYVDQLVYVEDVTERVTAEMETAGDEQSKEQLQTDILNGIVQEYGSNSEFEGLWFQPVTYYSGGRFSIYGYKRYDDIRLVLYPESDLGYFGGDPDNFTYPRYNLDVTFWRAYENGEPINTQANYFPFNTDGIKEGEVVFSVGNPGSTERYRTVAQLEYDRDYRFPSTLMMVRDRLKLMRKELAENPSPQLKNQIFSYSNAEKAYAGILKGLQNPDLFGRKKAMEEHIRNHLSQDNGQENSWTEIEKIYEEISPFHPEITFLTPSPLNAQIVPLLHTLYDYSSSLSNGSTEEELGSLREQLRNSFETLSTEKEILNLTVVLSELKMMADPEDQYIRQILDGRTPETAATEILSESGLTQEKKLTKFLKSKPRQVERSKDPLMELANLLIPVYKTGNQKFDEYNKLIRNLEQNVANAVFQVYGSSLPPDATFTLRISDGVVKPYAYNGTIAPINTTYFGLYDRHYSHGGVTPWDLPERWKNPSLDLLKSPINLISTNDITGGNSGSPLINKNKEAVGLIFDGNIQSLPSNFIFDDEYNRTVSVHAGGIIAAIKYIYRANRLYEELMDN